MEEDRQLVAVSNQKLERQLLVRNLPVIRVTSNDPQLQTFKKVMQRIRDVNQTEMQSNAQNRSRSLVGFDKSMANSHDSEWQSVLPNLKDTKRNIDLMILKQKQTQVGLQQNVADYKTLKSINDQFFFNPRQKLAEQQMRNHRRVYSNLSQPCLLSSEDSAIFTNRHMSHQGLKSPDTSRSILFSPKQSLNGSQIIQSGLLKNTGRKPQQRYKSNESLKLQYNQETFMKFYEFKKSLESQNILFNQLKQSQKAKKGDTEVKIQNLMNDHEGLLIGGKALNLEGVLKTVTVSPTDVQLQFGQDMQSKSEIFNRYGLLAFKLGNQIVIYGGEETKKRQGQKQRKLLSSLIFYDPQQFTYQEVNFKLPIVKTRAFSSSTIGKYLYYYGGYEEKGNILNSLIRIDLMQSKKELFEWRLIDSGKLNLPALAFSKMCPVYYEQRLTQMNHLIDEEQLFQDIDWKNALSYIKIEGIYMFGGINELNQPTNDVYILQICKQDKHKWIKPEISGKPPLPRYMHSLDHYSSVLIVHGGRNDVHKDLVLSDMFVLHLDTLTWVEVTFCNQRPIPRCNFESFVSHTKLYIMGGQTQNMAITHSYEAIELDQEVNFKNHISKYFLKKMAAFIMANFQKQREQQCHQQQVMKSEKLTEVEQLKAIVGKNRKQRQTLLNRLLGKSEKKL